MRWTWGTILVGKPPGKVYVFTIEPREDPSGGKNSEMKKKECLLPNRPFIKGSTPPLPKYLSNGF
jgi:hypothetical protein